MAIAVIVQDMLRGFMEEGHPLYCGSEARRIIPKVQQLLNDMKAKGADILHLTDAHEHDDKEFKMFPPHCIKGTIEAEIIPELSDYPGIVVPKQSYSSFYDTNLDDVMSEIAPDEVIVVGVCTDICVMYAVAELRSRGYPVTVYKDCVASFDQSAHEFALKHIENILGAHVIDKYESK